MPNKNDDKSVIDSEDEPIIEPVTVKLTDIATPLELRLRATEIWLSENAPSTASLQLMLLSKNPNPERALNRYLEKMENQGMNLDHFYIYTRLQDDRPVYGVLYGSYINRGEAVRQKKQLPAELGVKQPLPRTIRGIRDEISSN